MTHSTMSIRFTKELHLALEVLMSYLTTLNTFELYLLLGIDPRLIVHQVGIVAQNHISPNNLKDELNTVSTIAKS